LLAAERSAGLLLNGYPTGVEVCEAMVHGGPYPATSDARGTSVGTLSIDRFLRPVCYQNYPDALLPEALQDGNPLGIRRLVDGEVSQSSLIVSGQPLSRAGSLLQWIFGGHIDCEHPDQM
jgi:alpha-ketoglutaric semialdehyde dehydrogenase